MSLKCWIRIAALSFVPLSVLSAEFSSFDDFISAYENAKSSDRDEMLEDFINWQELHGGFPIVDANGGVIFFYVSASQKADVHVIGDFLPRSHFNHYWDSEGEKMRLAGSVYFLRRKFEMDARLDYRFVVDGESRLDPLNPRTLMSGVGEGEASELVMPQYVLPQEIAKRPGIPEGRLEVLSESWATPKVTVYLPPHYDATRRYPAVYTADGTAWVEQLKLPTVLDNLIADRAIEPVIAVMIDPTENRSDWYSFNPRYLAYLDHVVAYIDGHYSTQAQVAGRALVGTSAGGRAALYAGLERPVLFGQIGLLSAGLTGPISYFEPYLIGKRRPPAAMRFWISAGTYEGAIYDDAKTLSATLNAAGSNVHAYYTHEGHSFGAWRKAAVEALKYFYSGLTNGAQTPNM